MKKTKSVHNFTALIEYDKDGYYIGTVPSLKSCYTQAKTLEELGKRIKEVIELCLDEEEPDNLEFIAVQRFQVPIKEHA